MARNGMALVCGLQLHANMQAGAEPITEADAITLLQDESIDASPWVQHTTGNTITAFLSTLWR